MTQNAIRATQIWSALLKRRYLIGSDFLEEFHYIPSTLSSKCSTHPPPFLNHPLQVFREMYTCLHTHTVLSLSTSLFLCLCQFLLLPKSLVSLQPFAFSLLQPLFIRYLLSFVILFSFFPLHYLKCKCSFFVAVISPKGFEFFMGL